MKEELCKAFCSELRFREVPAGLGVSTPFDGFGGEPLAFFIIGPDELGRWAIEDDGRLVPFIEATGADLENEGRHQQFVDLLAEYGAEYDDSTKDLRLGPIAESQVPAAALKFMALLLRVQDLTFMARERVVRTFKDDVRRELQQVLGNLAEVKESIAVFPELSPIETDLLFEARGRDPVALFLVNNDKRLLEAIMLQMTAHYEAQRPLSVVALIENANSVTSKYRQQADNRLSKAPVYHGDERAALAQIQREVTGKYPALH